MLNTRTVTVTLSVALIILMTFTVQQIITKAKVVADPLNDSASVLTNQGEFIRESNAESIHSYRSPLDECYDVGLMELAACRKASQVPIPSYRPPLDECYDVGLMERTACRNASETLSASSSAASAISLSNQELRDILNGGYEHRVGLPR